MDLAHTGGGGGASAGPGAGRGRVGRGGVGRSGVGTGGVGRSVVVVRKMRQVVVMWQTQVPENCLMMMRRQMEEGGCVPR